MVISPIISIVNTGQILLKIIMNKQIEGKRSKRNRSDKYKKKRNRVRTKISGSDKAMVTYTREEKQVIMEEYRDSCKSKYPHIAKNNQACNSVRNRKY